MNSRTSIKLNRCLLIKSNRTTYYKIVVTQHQSNTRYKDKTLTVTINLGAIKTNPIKFRRTNLLFFVTVLNFTVHTLYWHNKNNIYRDICKTSLFSIWFAIIGYRGGYCYTIVVISIPIRSIFRNLCKTFKNVLKVGTEKATQIHLAKIRAIKRNSLS